MRINVWAFAAMMCLYWGVVAIGQDSLSLKLPEPMLDESPPAANPVDSAALAAPPALGDSGQIPPAPDVDGKAKISDTQPGSIPEPESKSVRISGSWTPKFIVTLQMKSIGAKGCSKRKKSRHTGVLAARWWRRDAPSMFLVTSFLESCH